MQVNARVGGKAQSPGIRRGAILALAVLLAFVALLLWNNRGFANYALSGFFWNSAMGTVVAAKPDSTPTVQFATADGATHSFREDYLVLCGGPYKFCIIRDFSIGEQVPVVYAPKAPATAFIHDWALQSYVIAVFLEAGAGLFLLLMLITLARERASG
jgi:Protein of unknown function (DUF3592)